MDCVSWPLRRTCALTAVIALTVSGGATARAEPTGPTPATEIPGLIADVAEVDQRLANLGAAIHSQQEAVQKALVDIESARTASQDARAFLATARRELEDSVNRIDDLQRRFDQFAVSRYMSGPSDGALSALDHDDMIAAAAADPSFATAYSQVRTDLERARTDNINRESAARAAEARATHAEQVAEDRYDDAVQALRSAEAVFARQKSEIDTLVRERDHARAQLDNARRAPETPVGSPPSPSPARVQVQQDWDHSASSAPAAQWDTAVPAVPGADLSDPVAIVNTVLQISASSAQATANLGRQFLAKLGIVAEPTAAATPAPTGQIPRVYGQQAAEYVIRRGMTQLGVPYSWGGGNATGATNGIDRGSGTVGFDCSGLMVFAFAGVGIKLPKYSGSQYNLGRRVPVSQMRRGDLIFYGPNGSQHVALFLGQGQMLEAPFTGSQVRVAPVRTSGMTTHVVRLIEY